MHRDKAAAASARPRTSTETSADWKARVLLIASALILLVSVAIVSWRAFAASQGGDNGGITVEYTTEPGVERGVGIVDAPLQVAVRVPWSDGRQETIISNMTLRLLDENGQPATFGGQPAEALPLAPTFKIDVWEYRGSVPGVPGRYHPRLEWQFLYGDQKVNSAELPNAVLEVRPEPGPPLVSGYAFADQSNLWLLSTDLSKQRRRTFYPAMTEYADKPAWSPDGSTIAYTYSPATPPDQLPSTDVWIIRPDGTDARALVTHEENEAVYDPVWSPDGRYVYFTSEQLNVPLPESGLPESVRRIDRADSADGRREQIVTSAHMPHLVGLPDGTVRMVYLEEVPSEEAIYTGSIFDRLVIADADGSNARTLVDIGRFPDMYAPRLSPDGKWVVFDAVNVPTGGGGATSGTPDFLKWLLFEPETASAHGLPWDLYLVSTSGGPVTRLTTMVPDEDQPVAVWLDSNTIVFNGITGMYRLKITEDGQPAGEPEKIHAGAPHGGLSWHGP